MKEATQVVFRRITKAEYYNLYKPKGSEPSGGGQTYIDFPTSSVRPRDWKRFLHRQKTLTSRSGPHWRIKLNSLGLARSQFVEVGQRRPQSFNIRRQTLGRKNSNRIFAWHPKYSGFPQPQDPTRRVGISNLVIYLIRTSNGEFWAGFFRTATPEPSWQVDHRLNTMFTNLVGTIDLNPGILFDPTDDTWPFRGVSQISAPPVKEPSQKLTAARSSLETPISQIIPTRRLHKQKTEDEIMAALFSEDLSVESEKVKKQAILNIVKRNLGIVKALKQLYRGECQLTGQKFTFKKENGEMYCEAHHIIALGEKGADSPYNVIIVSPLVHRMLHYAKVSGLDLRKITGNKLQIKINNESFTITWHPRHAELVSAATKYLEPLP